MSSLAFLVTELQALASETKRKYPEVREASEKSLAILRSSPEQAVNQLAVDGPQSQDLLRPVFMGCATKNTKITSISLGSLQRLIALQAVPLSAVPSIISTMNECMSQGVDIQLRILQTLLSLITNFSAIHGSLLGDALLLCFKMQESRIAVVSSTAAATLRQIVMFIVDKVVDEDRKDILNPSDKTDISLPDGTHRALGPSALDAFLVVQDLCLLANAEKPHFLKLGALPKTFALELIESVLTNYHDLFRQHAELLVLLRHHLCPLLLRLLSEKPLFPLTLRSTRVVFLLLKQFSGELITEAEVFLSLLVKIVAGDQDIHMPDSTPSISPRPSWMRVLAMEIIRGICNDAELMRFIWETYDAQEASSNLFGSLISILTRLVMEKPGLLGVSSQMFGVGVSSQHIDPGPIPATPSYSVFDVATVAGMVANAASSTITGVVGMMGTEHGLSVATSSMKIQCIDQLDKADAPAIPEGYIYLLGLQCLVSICEGFASLTLPLFNAIVVQKSRAAGESTVKAPAALDLSTLSQDQDSTKQLKSVHAMVENGWPALLAALSFLISTNLSDELFGDVLQSYQNMANVSGMLGLTTPRDAFLTSLAKSAIPSRVVSSVDSYVEPPLSRAGDLSLAALSGSGASQPPGLSERNMACLKILVMSAIFLSGSLGSSWFDVLESLQNAEYVLTSKGQKTILAKRFNSGSAPVSGSKTPTQSATVQSVTNVNSSQSRHPLLNELEPESILRAVQRLFDSSKNLDDQAFHDFVSALCRLSAEMVDMQSDASVALLESESSESTQALAPITSQDPAHRRRVSGIHVARTLRSGDFSINKLSHVSKLNIIRFTHRSPEIAWTVVTSHLVSVLRNKLAPHTIRLQAARALDDILLLVPRHAGSSEERRRTVQRLMFDVLSLQIAPEPSAANSTTVIEVRKMGLETLHLILQSAGHTILIGWETIFDMLGSVCEPVTSILPVPSEKSVVSSPSTSTIGLGHPSEKNSVVLVRTAFQSLTLVCDSLTGLSPDHLKMCISTLGKFGRQIDTNIALTAAGSLLWGVSDSIQARRKTSEQEAQYSALWMFLLLEVLGLCTDPRPEVRIGAIQTLFRSMQLYGATLGLDTWDDCIWKVTFPLLESITTIMRQTPIVSPLDGLQLGLPTEGRQAWEESKTLTLQSITTIFTEYLLSKIIHLPSFDRAWAVFVQHMQDTFLLDGPLTRSAAMSCLEKAIKVAEQASVKDDVKEKVSNIWERAWKAADDIAISMLNRKRAEVANSDPITIAFDQDNLLAYIDMIKSVRSLSRSIEGSEWPLERIARLMIILKSVLTYSNSPNYRPDTDGLTPVQAAIVSVIEDINLSSIPASPSLVLRNLSEMVTLPFLAAFDVPSSQPDAASESTKEVARVTYIGLAKKVMPLLLDIFMQFKFVDEIYSDETVEAILSAYAVPMKMKYECPPASKFGNDSPLWKTATSMFLRVVKESASQLRRRDSKIPDGRVEGVWRQIIEGFRGGILSDCRTAESLPFAEQEAEETFDLSLLASLEVDVVPFIADERVPDYVVTQVAKILHQGSLLYQQDDIKESSSPASPIKSASSRHTSDFTGSTVQSSRLPRERFSYWCLDLLFLICSDTAKDQEDLRRRVAALCLPSLLQRAQATLLSYLADEALRGNYPFPRTREEELVHVLKKLLSLRLWEGSFSAALSTSPSKNAIQQPTIDIHKSPSQILEEATRRSTKAHLFHFFSPLCKIAALPRMAPVAWTFVGTHNDKLEQKAGEDELKVSRVADAATNGTQEELDARHLAAACLDAVGEEWNA